MASVPELQKFGKQIQAHREEVTALCGKGNSITSVREENRGEKHSKGPRIHRVDGTQGSETGKILSYPSKRNLKTGRWREERR